MKTVPSSTPERNGSAGPTGFLVTCEHATNFVPPRYEHLFSQARAVLQTHRAWDPGARESADQIARALRCRAHFGTVTRLIIDLNRSRTNEALWSEFMADVSLQVRAGLLGEFYIPFRSEVERDLRQIIRRGQHALHLSIHSFTPELNGEVRDADFGILFDPARPREVAWAECIAELACRLLPRERIRFNYPYLGTDDGHTTALRKLFPDADYAGIELEWNHRLLKDREAWESLVQKFAVEMGSLRTSAQH